MRAHQIMTKDVITVSPETPIVDAANLMLQQHISGLPVVTSSGRLVGMVTEADFLHRAEIGTERKRGRWLQYLLGPGRLADDFTHERGRKVEDVMTSDPMTVPEDMALDQLVATMEEHDVKRLPVMRGEELVGIVTRANLLRAVSTMARDVPDPTADDDHVRERIMRAISGNDWRPLGLQVTVREGVVHLYGIIVDERSRKAARVAVENTAGVKEIHDHLCWVDSYSGYAINAEEDKKVIAGTFNR